MTGNYANKETNKRYGTRRTLKNIIGREEDLFKVMDLFDIRKIQAHFDNNSKCWIFRTDNNPGTHDLYLLSKVVGRTSSMVNRYNIEETGDIILYASKVGETNNKEFSPETDIKEYSTKLTLENIIGKEPSLFKVNDSFSVKKVSGRFDNESGSWIYSSNNEYGPLVIDSPNNESDTHYLYLLYKLRRANNKLPKEVNDIILYNSKVNADYDFTII